MPCPAAAPSSSGGDSELREGSAELECSPPPAPPLCKADRSSCRVPGCQRELLPGFLTRCRCCEFHSRQDSVELEGAPCRFCQQCGFFHPLEEFDELRRSCRKSLERHRLCRKLRRERALQAAAAAAAGGGEPQPAKRAPPAASPVKAKPKAAAAGKRQPKAGSKRAAEGGGGRAAAQAKRASPTPQPQPSAPPPALPQPDLGRVKKEAVERQMSPGSKSASPPPLPPSPGGVEAGPLQPQRLACALLRLPPSHSPAVAAAAAAGCGEGPAALLLSSAGSSLASTGTHSGGGFGAAAPLPPAGAPLWLPLGGWAALGLEPPFGGGAAPLPPPPPLPLLPAVEAALELLRAPTPIFDDMPGTVEMLVINAELGLLGGGRRDAAAAPAPLPQPLCDASVWPPTPHYHPLSLGAPPAAASEPAWHGMQQVLAAQRRRQAAAAPHALL